MADDDHPDDLDAARVHIADSLAGLGKTARLIEEMGGLKAAQEAIGVFGTSSAIKALGLESTKASQALGLGWHKQEDDFAAALAAVGGGIAGKFDSALMAALTGIASKFDSAAIAGLGGLFRKFDSAAMAGVSRVLDSNSKSNTAAQLFEQQQDWLTAIGKPSPWLADFGKVIPDYPSQFGKGLSAIFAAAAENTFSLDPVIAEAAPVEAVAEPPEQSWSAPPPVITSVRLSPSVALAIVIFLLQVALALYLHSETRQDSTATVQAIEELAAQCAGAPMTH